MSDLKRILSKCSVHPVSSKLIADFIKWCIEKVIYIAVVLLGFGGLGIAWYLDRLYQLWILAKESWYILIIIFLCGIILLLYVENRNLKKRLQPPEFKTGLEYLISLPKNECDDFKSYLEWFPINNKMRVKNNRGNDVEYKPIFRKMLDHKVLKKQLNYYIIDQEVYDYLKNHVELLTNEYRQDYSSETADDDFIGMILDN